MLIIYSRFVSGFLPDIADTPHKEASRMTKYVLPWYKRLTHAWASMMGPNVWQDWDVHRQDSFKKGKSPSKKVKQS